jgi:hypothetical protein
MGEDAAAEEVAKEDRLETENLRVGLEDEVEP